MPLFADLLPPRARQVIYIALGIYVPLEAIWNIVPDPYDGKILATFTALGFALAASNITPKETPHD